MSTTRLAQDFDELTVLARYRTALERWPEPTVFYRPDQARRVRKASGLSQEHVAKILGASTYSVRGWEAGDHVPAGDNELRWQTLTSLLHKAALNSGTLDHQANPTDQAGDEPVAATT